MTKICSIGTGKNTKYYTLDSHGGGYSMLINCNKDGSHIGEACHIIKIGMEGIYPLGGWKNQTLVCDNNGKVVITPEKKVKNIEIPTDAPIYITLYQSTKYKFLIVSVDKNGHYKDTIASVTKDGIERRKLKGGTPFRTDEDGFVAAYG